MFKACDRDAAGAFHCSWTLCVHISLLVHRCISRLFRLSEQIIDFFFFFLLRWWNTLLEFLMDLYLLAAKPSFLLC